MKIKNKNKTVIYSIWTSVTKYLIPVLLNLQYALRRGKKHLIWETGSNKHFEEVKMIPVWQQSRGKICVSAERTLNSACFKMERVSWTRPFWILAIMVAPWFFRNELAGKYFRESFIQEASQDLNPGFGSWTREAGTSSKQHKLVNFAVWNLLHPYINSSYSLSFIFWPHPQVLFKPSWNVLTKISFGFFSGYHRVKILTCPLIFQLVN